MAGICGGCGHSECTIIAGYSHGRRMSSNSNGMYEAHRLPDGRIVYVAGNGYFNPKASDSGSKLTSPPDDNDPPANPEYADGDHGDAPGPSRTQSWVDDANTEHDEYSSSGDESSNAALSKASTSKNPIRPKDSISLVGGKGGSEKENKRKAGHYNGGNLAKSKHGHKNNTSSGLGGFFTGTSTYGSKKNKK